MTIIKVDPPICVEAKHFDDLKEMVKKAHPGETYSAGIRRHLARHSVHRTLGGDSRRQQRLKYLSLLVHPAGLEPATF